MSEQSIRLKSKVAAFARNAGKGLTFPAFWRTRLHAMLLLCGLFPPLARADVPADDDVPLVGRPADLPFSGASAPFARGPGPEYRLPFQIAIAATPKRLEAQTPLTYTVTVTAVAPVHRPPVRIDLRELPAFARAFFIEPFTDGKNEQIGPTSWQWIYKLKPRQAWVDEIPGLPFVFYNPDLRPSEKAFQVIWTDAIPLRVEPPEPLSATLDLPESMLELAVGPSVLAERRPWRLPSVFVLGILLAGPPLWCICWYQLWRRRYPDIARQTHLRRSRAAQRALKTLAAAPAAIGPARGDHVAVAIAGYLRERFDRAPVEPTPTETAELIAAQGCPLDLAKQAESLLRACAAERFPPEPIEEFDLVEQARAFILAVEDLT